MKDLRILMEGFKKGLNELDNKKNYGVFTYRLSDDETIDTEEGFQTPEEAIEFAKRIETTWPKDEYYIEVWLQDEEGLWGNSGEPIWKNDTY